MTDTNTTRRALLKLSSGALAYGAGATLVSLAGVVGAAQLAPPAQAATMTASAKSLAEWQRLLSAEREAYRAYMAASDDASVELGDKWSVIDSALMATPAPNHAALLVKLNRLFPEEEAGQSTASWSWEYAAQSIADFRRLLGTAA